MDVCWKLFRFDYARYLELRPGLRSANAPEAFAALAENEAEDAIAPALDAGEITLEIARGLIVQSQCCLGEPLPFTRGLPGVVGWLASRPATEDAAELLGALMTGGKNLEPWLTSASGLAGFLTPDETARFSAMLQAAPARRKRGGRRLRTGGLVGACAGFVRRLFDLTPLPSEMLALLAQMAQTAAVNGEGLALAAA